MSEALFRRLQLAPSGRFKRPMQKVITCAGNKGQGGGVKLSAKSNATARALYGRYPDWQPLGNWYHPKSRVINVTRRGAMNAVVQHSPLSEKVNCGHETMKIHFCTELLVAAADASPQPILNGRGAVEQFCLAAVAARS